MNAKNEREDANPQMPMADHETARRVAAGADPSPSASGSRDADAATVGGKGEREPTDGTPAGRAVAIAVGMATMVAVILLAFSWPTLSSEPRDLPIDVVGTTEQVGQLGKQVGQKSDRAFDLRPTASRDVAVRQIEERKAVGAIVMPGKPGGAPEVLIASAGNAQIAQMLRTMASQMEAQLNAKVLEKVETQVDGMLSGSAPTNPSPDGQRRFTIPTVTVKVTDVVPLSADDERGVGMGLAVLPLVMGGVSGAIVLSTAIKGMRRQLYATLVYATTAGLVIACILQGWFGVIQNGFALNAAVVGLEIAAISTVIIGLKHLVGNAGLGIMALAMVLVGNPLSGATIPGSFLPGPWGAIGQLLPPGAATSLLRNLSYFPEANTAPQWAVLLTWLAAGLALNAAAKYAARRRASSVGRA